MKSSSNSNQQDKKRTIRRIIIIIILILLLITSCTAYNYFGRLGHLISQDVSIDDNIGNKKIIKNINLRFDLSDKDYKDGIKVNLSNLEYKLSYTLKDIYGKNVTCSTNDASIATCRVEDGYVVLNLKQVGKVNLQIQSEENDAIYIAEVDVEIEGKKSSPTNRGEKIPSKEEYDKKKEEEKSSDDKKDDDKKDDDKKDDEKEESKSSDSSLKSLSIDNYRLSPSFNKNTFEYSITIPYDVTSVNAYGTTNDGKARFYVEGNTNLKVGLNTVNVVVVAEDGTTSTYKVIVNRLNQEAVTEKFITSLTVNNATLTPSFNTNVTNYTVNVGSDVNSLDLSIVDASGFNHNVIGNSNFQTGDNYVYINSYDDDNEQTKQYVIKVVKDAPVIVYDARLTSLTSSVGSLEPAFDSDVKSYTIKVPYDTTSITIDAAANSDTTISGKGTYNVDLGEQTITINTVSGDKSESYSVKVIKYSVNLSSLSVSGYNINPTFNKDVTSYSLTVPNSQTSISVNAASEDGVSSVEVIGDNNLMVGDNQVLVKVTTPLGEEKTYTITVNREIDYDQYYVSSPTTYDASFIDNSSDNYKNIILNTNIFEHTVTTSTSGNKYILSDGSSRIELESNDINFEYIASSSLSSLTIKSSYSSAGTKTVNVVGYKDDHEIERYTITFNVVNKYNVKLDANGGFFTEANSLHELLMEENEVIDLSEYNTAYKESGIACTYYTLDHYNTSSDDSGSSYALDATITITGDITLYAIYSETNTEVDVTTSKTLYLSEVDIFDLEHNSYNNKIYPGISGSYNINFKNDTSNKVKIDAMRLSEDSICVDEYCINMGYIVKTADNYYLGSSNNYQILNSYIPFADKVHNTNDTYTSYKDITIGDIELNSGEEVELSLVWKWIDNDNNDYKIGNYVKDNPTKDIYYITVSFDLSFTDKVCN